MVRHPFLSGGGSSASVRELYRTERMLLRSVSHSLPGCAPAQSPRPAGTLQRGWFVVPRFERDLAVDGGAAVHPPVVARSPDRATAAHFAMPSWLSRNAWVNACSLRASY